MCCKDVQEPSVSYHTRDLQDIVGFPCYGKFKVEARKLEHDYPHALKIKSIRNPSTNPPNPHVPTFWDPKILGRIRETP